MCLFARFPPFNARQLTLCTCSIPLKRRYIRIYLAVILAAAVASHPWTGANLGQGGRQYGAGTGAQNAARAGSGEDSKDFTPGEAATYTKNEDLE
jgi:hypothetical protein